MRSMIVLSAMVFFLGFAASFARADLYINEIYFDPPGSTDGISEYVELRGTPSESLSNCYLIFLENENTSTNTGDPGHVEFIFDLSTYSVGSNGFLTMRQKNTTFTGEYAPVAGTTNLVNTGTGFGWGNGASSSIHASQEAGGGVIENSGFTAMLIRNNGTSGYAPYLGQDLDQNNDGLDAVGSDVNQWRTNWTILDSIGIHSEEGEAQYGRLYGNINFGPESTTQVEPGATYVGVGFEIEHVARWGDSTGQTPYDWNVSNLTNNAATGFTEVPDYRQAGDPHPVDGVFDPSFQLESSHGVPYGTPLCRSLGETNFTLVPGDTNGDDIVDETDAEVLAENWGTAVDSGAFNGDFNCDGQVDARDASILAANWGTHLSTENATTVPEPSSFIVMLAGLFCMVGRRRETTER